MKMADFLSILINYLITYKLFPIIYLFKNTMSLKELHTCFPIMIIFNNIEEYGNRSLFNLKHFTITITNIKKIILETF